MATRRPTTTAAKSIDATTAAALHFSGLDELIGYRLRRAQSAVHRDYNAMFEELKLTQKQTGVMWLVVSNPGLAQGIFNYNERYIFFRFLPDSPGPIGALGVPLTPGRSIATDLKIFPAGALGFLVSRQPDLDEAGKIVGWKPLRRFVLNQDTGAAIQGPGRVDLFFGSGERAGTAAGEMREEGKVYFLLAK